MTFTPKPGFGSLFKNDGRTLPEHELPGEHTCDLCGAPCDADPTVWDTAGYDICTQCLEDML